MSKLALATAKQLCKIVEKRGFFKVRQKGSHVFYCDDYGNTTVIPMHTGDLKRGLIRGILSDTKISIEEYEQLRKEV